MNQQDLLTLRKFSTEQGAKELQNFLYRQGIDAEIVENKPELEYYFGSTSVVEYEVKIDRSDLTNAEQVIERDTKASLEFIDESYYLYDFTHDELWQILKEYDKWSDFDYELAQKILKEHGASIDDTLLDTYRKERIQQLSTPAKSPTFLIVSGYVLSLIGILGGLGIIIGYILFASKKSLPNGEKVYYYGKGDRRHGSIMCLIGSITLIVGIGVRMNMGLF